MAQLIQNTLSRFVDSGEIAGCSARIMRGDETECCRSKIVFY